MTTSLTPDEISELLRAMGFTLDFGSPYAAFSSLTLEDVLGWMESFANRVEVCSQVVGWSKDSHRQSRSIRELEYFVTFYLGRKEYLEGYYSTRDKATCRAALALHRAMGGKEQ